MLHSYTKSNEMTGSRERSRHHVPLEVDNNHLSLVRPHMAFRLIHHPWHTADTKRYLGLVQRPDPLLLPLHGFTSSRIVFDLFRPSKWRHVWHVDEFVLENNGHNNFI